MKTPLDMKQLTAKLHAMSYEERREIAKKSGVPFNTIHKYSYSYNVPASPMWRTVSRIWAAL